MMRGLLKAGSSGMMGKALVSIAIPPIPSCNTRFLDIL